MFNQLIPLNLFYVTIISDKFKTLFLEPFSVIFGRQFIIYSFFILFDFFHLQHFYEIVCDVGI